MYIVVLGPEDENMKKILMAMFIMTVFLMSIVPAFADDDVETDYAELGDLSEDESNEIEGDGVSGDLSVDEVDEIEVMETFEGKEQRLEQLRASIERAIIVGKEAWASFENVSAEDQEALEDVISKLDALLLEIDMIDSSEDNAVDSYVSIKREAMELVKEFKQISKKYISPDKARELRESILKRNKERIETMKEKVKEKVRMTHARNANKFMEKFGLQDEELIDQYKSGQIKNEELRKEIMEKVKSFSNEIKEKKIEEMKEKKEELKERIQEHRVSNEIKEKVRSGLIPSSPEEKDMMREKIRKQVKDIKERRAMKSKEVNKE